MGSVAFQRTSDGKYGGIRKGGLRSFRSEDRLHQRSAPNVRGLRLRGDGCGGATIPDIGILASTDILAIDQASIDLVWAKPENEKHDLVERIESRHGLRQLSYMKELGMGTDQYRIIRVD